LRMGFRRLRLLITSAALLALGGCCAKPLVMPDAGYRASITVLNPPSLLGKGEKRTLRVNVKNASSVEWQTGGVDRKDPWRGNDNGQYAMYLGDHWLNADGTVAINDDARSQPPDMLAPGETCTTKLAVQAPTTPGEYILEVDLVQESVTWFAQKGSTTARYPVKVE
jgi:hypothetical protein